MRKIKLVIISDTHGRHRQLSVPDGDILIHGGDMTAHGELSEVWDFNDYLGTLPHPHKLIIAGNHDFCFQRETAAGTALLTNGTYLQDSGVTIANINFYGSPWQPWFFDWAFNLQRGPEIKAKWDLIPPDTDVLITHGPPLGHGDRTFQNADVGCQDLMAAVERIRPRLHIFGHIHEAAGITRNEHTIFMNGSSCTLSYKPTNPPLVYDYEV